MTNILRNSRGLALAMALLLGFTGFAQAQVTTGAINGVVTDESGGVLPGATVTAVHGPTGTRYTAVTGTDGRYDILNVRVGGPYTVTVAMPGFKTGTKSDLGVVLGGATGVPFKLGVAAMTETVEVTADAGLISSTRTGPAANVAQEAIENMPTVSRSITDMARLSPHFTPMGNGAGDGPDVLSVGGRSSRYNNIQIDGANNNDLFALASNSGNPGGGTATQPISFDAIAEIQLVVAPYDVRQGGFSGGGVNAVTRSGTNQFHGTAMYEFRSQKLVGDSAPTFSVTGQSVAAARPISTFSEKQATFSIGGPIKKDKVFFFVNGDLTRNETPTGWSADGSSGQTFTVPKADLDRFLSILKNNYGYDPSAGKTALGEFTRNTRSNKIFARLDFNLSDKHRLTVRNNYTRPRTDVGFPSNSSFKTPDNYYQVNNRSNSTVAQLNSTLGKGVNELRVNYQLIRDIRDGVGAFPSIRVDLTPAVCGSATCSILAGREAFSGANELYQTVIELTDDYTFHKGNHLITIGTHNEFFKFKNLFIRDNFGTYRFSNLDNFAAGVAQQFDYSFSATSDPRQAAKFSVNQFGFYAGDVWRAKSNLTINYGLRVDIPTFPTKPSANPVAVANFGFATDTVPAPKMWSPRAGFNWDIGGDAKQQLRGGLGVFAGRPPYVWLSNQYGNTGVDFTRIGAAFNTASRIPFVANPTAQPKVVTGAAAGTFTNEIDLVDPDFKYPQLLRSNLAYDRSLGFFGLVGTIEGIYGKTLQDIDYRNLNFVKSANTRISDGRPIFTRKVASLSDVIFLTNTTKGRSWTVSGKVERPFRNGLFFTASYLYGKSYSVNDGGSDQAASNFANNYVPGDSNAAPLTMSRFSPGHRINTAVSYNWKVSKKANLTVSGYYNGQSGRPYTFLFLSDINGDTKTGNDLVFYPASADQVNFTNGTYAQFDAYMQSMGAGKYKGQVVPRNALRSPWTNNVDLSAAVKVPVKSKQIEFKVDLLNALNFVNQKWGQIDYALFNDLVPFGVSIDAPTGKYIYNIATINLPTYIKWNRDDLRSRWQAAFSARVRF
jgi:outer membrane receptor for ferrienterochelin and colicin